MDNKTIAAISTAPGEAGIGIIRISGTLSFDILRNIYRDKESKARDEFKSRYMYYGTAVNSNGNVIDEALFVFMKGPYSYTGEDVCEIQCHGGSVSTGEILSRALGLGAEVAEPGEFTKRAFLNGRLDLSQAEAVMDIISSKTGRALNVAVEQLKGNISIKIREIMNICISLLAHIEASIDFPEHDIEEVTSEKIREELLMALKLVKNLETGFEEGRFIREGIKTAIVGKPNVGKSSLLNALLKDERAIVTDVPGTTRDIIEESLNVSGILVKIIDTAGLRNTEDLVESIGIDRTKKAIDTADIVLFILDGSEEITDEDREIATLLKNKKVVIVLNKNDKVRNDEFDERIIIRQNEFIKECFIDKKNEIQLIKTINVSAKELTNIHLLEDVIKSLVENGIIQQEGSTPITNARHRDLIQKAERILSGSINELNDGVPVDLLSIQIKEAWRMLGLITGDSVSTDISKEIFSRFCVGK